MNFSIHKRIRPLTFYILHTPLFKIKMFILNFLMNFFPCQHSFGEKLWSTKWSTKILDGFSYSKYLSHFEVFSRALCWVYTTYFWRVTYNNMFLIFHFFKAKINFVFCWQMIMMVWKGADIYFSIHKCKANNFLKCQREGN